MRYFIALMIRLLSIAVIAVNFLYLQRGQVISLDSWLTTVKPILTVLFIAIFIGSILLMFTGSVRSITKLVVVVLLIALAFPLYHPYIARFFA